MADQIEVVIKRVAYTLFAAVASTATFFFRRRPTRKANYTTVVSFGMKFVLCYDFGVSILHTAGNAVLSYQMLSAAYTRGVREFNASSKRLSREGLLGESTTRCFGYIYYIYVNVLFSVRILFRFMAQYCGHTLHQTEWFSANKFSPKKC